MSTLYLMRHGETLFNQLHLIQGWCDSPLTKRGQVQARIAGEYFLKQGIHFDAAVSSTQERASDTLERVAPGLSYQRLKGLKEWNFGRFEAQPEFLNPKPPYGDFFKYVGGESQSEVEERLFETLSELMAVCSERSKVLAVSHGGALACFTRATGNQLPRGLKNCCILKFSYESNGKFILEEVINHDFSELERKEK